MFGKMNKNVQCIEQRINMHERKQVNILLGRMQEPRRFIQIIIGPRQVGKSTALSQALRKQVLPFVFARADAAQPASRAWLRAQWAEARSLITNNNSSAILVIDEVQKIYQWSEEVKALWDEDSFDGIDLRVFLCGSSSLLLSKEMNESLMGRFELIKMTHWNYSECAEAFGLSLNEYLLFGGYPGALGLRNDPARWVSYMNDSIIGSTISNDILMTESVAKPALLQALFKLGTAYSGREISYRKLMGQLDDAGNATTIAHYLDLLGKARMLAAIPKYGDKEITVRNSTPRLMVYDTSLITASAITGRGDLVQDHSKRGHMIESAVGAYLLGKESLGELNVFWWRENNSETDFVVRKNGATIAVEVKSGANTNIAGTADFLKKHPKAERIVVGPKDDSIERFLRGEII